MLGLVLNYFLFFPSFQKNLKKREHIYIYIYIYLLVNGRSKKGCNGLPSFLGVREEL